MFEQLEVKELELNEAHQQQLSDMTDEYLGKVEAEHGKAVRKTIEAIISARMYNHALASSMAVFKVDKELAKLVASLSSSYAAVSIAQVSRAYGLNPTDEQVEAWNAIAERFVNNANSIAKSAVDGAKLH